ncbi:unnamed protein product [Parajaminaea phylloscopi]
MSAAAASGRCNCGKFAFEVPAHQGIAACFCKSCVRTGGALCTLVAAIPAGSIKFTKGSEEELSVYEDMETTSGKPMKRSFCGSCGSAVYSIPSDSHVTYFKYSLLDDTEAYTKGQGPNTVLFTSEAPSWSKGGSGGHLQWPRPDAPTKYIAKQ